MPREPGRGASFSAAARRRIQHTAALAEAMGNIHSFEVFATLVLWYQVSYMDLGRETFTACFL